VKFQFDPNQSFQLDAVAAMESSPDFRSPLTSTT
jgi:hypothetical protein